MFEYPGLGVLQAGDVTGDDIYDLAVGHPDANAVHVLRGRNGMKMPAAFDMTFAEHLEGSHRIGNPSGRGHQRQRQGRFAVAKNGYRWSVGWLMNGHRVTETRWLSVAAVSDMNRNVVATEDVNGDGTSDMIWQHANGGGRSLDVERFHSALHANDQPQWGGEQRVENRWAEIVFERGGAPASPLTVSRMR